MNRKMKLTLFMCILLIASLALGGCTVYGNSGINKQEQTILFENIKEQDINSKNMMGIIRELSSEKYKGRLAGTKGNEMATKYIADYFEEIGLKNPENLENYLQYYNQNVRFTYSAPQLEILDSDGKLTESYEYIKEFSVNTGNTSLSIKGDIIGKGVIVNGVKKLLEESEIDKETIILVPSDVLAKIGHRNLISKAIDLGSNISGIITEVNIESPNYMYSGFVVGPNAQPVVAFNKSGPLLFSCDSSTFKELVAASSKESKIHIKADYSIEKIEAANVIGLIEGSDENLKNEFIIIGAHFDHAGDNKNGTYNPGALDNASGTAAMMEIARVLQDGNYKPKKSILFIAFNGEEEGLYGSYYYADNPIYPLDKSTTTMINLDMVGSKTVMPLTLLNYDSINIELRDQFYKYSKELGIETIQDVGQGSDHSPFGAKGVDSLCLIHMDLKNGYHTPGDTVDKIDQERIEEVAKLVLFYLDKNAF